MPRKLNEVNTSAPRGRAAYLPAPTEAVKEREKAPIILEGEKTRKSETYKNRGVYFRNDLYHAVRIAAAEEDRRISEIVEEAVENWLKQRKPGYPLEIK